MEPTFLGELAAMMGGTLLQGEGTRSVSRLHTDSRTLQPGDVFIALAGENFDGHDYLADAVKKGAAAAVVSRPCAGLPESFTLIHVPDTTVALQQGAAAYRRVHPVQVVGVTGSNGKTSTKEMIAAVLGRRFPVVATEGNLNNHLGVPLTLFRVEARTAYAVVEMGMNHRGEIAPLARLAAPRIGVITGIGSAHIEFLGSARAIAEEKTDLVAALPADGVAVLNGDDPLLREYGARAPGKVVWVSGTGAEADWRAEGVHFTPQGIAFDLCGLGGSIPVVLPLFSRVMVGNALLAAAVGAEAGLSLQEIAAGLSAMRPAKGRMNVRRRQQGWIIDDSYNANPESMAAACASLREFPAPARRVAVIGSMGELGEQAPALHRQVGEAAAGSGAALLFVVGPNAAALEAGALAAGYPAAALHRCATTAEAVALVPTLLRADDTILLKGSRFMKLETVGAVLESTLIPA